MKGAFLYVDAGKGHYVPAVALADSFRNAGHEVIVEDLFVPFKTKFWPWFCKYEWRFLLKHPKWEKSFHSNSDNKSTYRFIRNQVNLFGRAKNFKAWYEKEKPDFIISTHFLGGILLTKALEKTGIDVPIFQYAPDIFDTPSIGVCSDIDKFYISSDLGVKTTISYGQPPETVVKCPFPLKGEISNYIVQGKTKAREKLGLKNKFTLLLTLGGEGIGDISLLDGMLKRGLDIQVIIIGGNHAATQKAFDAFIKNHPGFDLVRPGFVNNIHEYIDASDIQVGKAGANTLMETLYLKRPCLVSEVLFMARKVELFFKDYPVGWSEDDLEKKLDIIESCYRDENVLKDIAKRFEQLPLSFSSDEFRDMIIRDYEEIKSRKH